MLGASWGSTLALAYAQTHPERVHALTLVSVTTTSPHQVHWVTHQMRHIFPEAWQDFRDAAGPHADPHHLTNAYARLLADPDPAVRERAARAWPTAQLTICPDAGHISGQSPMLQAARAATDHFA